MIDTTTKFLTAEQAAEYLTNERGLITSVHSLRKFIVNGKGPDSYVYGKRRRLYSKEDLDKWAEARLVKYTPIG